MGVFTRMRDIINSNINAMLERAENPEKLIKLMIQEMEDTLVEIKASCAGAMASRKDVGRALDAAGSQRDKWDDRARRAVAMGRDDLAREALVERNRSAERVASLEHEAGEFDSLIQQYRDDICQLEEKLSNARDKQRILVQRHQHARKRKRAQEGIRRVDTSDAWVRFDQLEGRIDRLEAEADLVNYGRRPSVEERFAEMEGDGEIERQLEALKASVKSETKAPQGDS